MFKLARKKLALVLCLFMLFTLIQGISFGGTAVAAADVNILSGDATFDSDTVGAQSPFFNVMGENSLVKSGGAFNTAKSVTVLAPWKVVLHQEGTGFVTAGKFYEYSAWIKGSKPYVFSVDVYNGSAYVQFPMTLPANISGTWQYVAIRFTAPAGSGNGIKGADGHMLIRFQANMAEFSIDQLMLKEVTSLTLPPAPTAPPATATPSPTPFTTPDPNATAAPVKIMCIGDSITQGSAGSGASSTEYSYRYPLWKLLVDNNANFEFVGSRNYGFNSTPVYADYKGKAFNNKHEGYWGWTIQAVTEALVVQLAEIIPDVAIIYLGTNGGESVTQKAAYMKTQIETLRAANPKIKILLGEPCQTYMTEMQTSYKAGGQISAKRILKV